MRLLGSAQPEEIHAAPASFYGNRGMTVTQAQAADKPHNLVLFVPDGMRAKMVTPETAPTMAAIRDQGVNFQNSHSMFPTFTMPNASAMATGHRLGDTGVFQQHVLVGATSTTPVRRLVLENDAALGTSISTTAAISSTRQRCSLPRAAPASAPPRSARSARS